MTGERHEPNLDTYAIGSADTMVADYTGGTYTIQFDLQQVRENNFVRYYIEEFKHGVFFDTPLIPENKSVAQCWAEDIDKRTHEDIRAFLVPNYIGESFTDLEGYEVLYTSR